MRDGCCSVGSEESMLVDQGARRRAPSVPWILLLVVLLLGSVLPTAHSQTVGTEICACQPATYEFTLDFDLTCDDTNVGGPGINASACVLNTDVELNVTNFRPNIVTTIQILELNQDFEVLAQTPLEGEFADGDTFRYTSIIAGQVGELDPADIPRGFQLSMAGRNSNEEDLVNFWLIIYDNNCGVFPVVLEGQQIGWTIFSNLTNPPSSLCPLASEAPTQGPSDQPSDQPSDMPSYPPSVRPTAAGVETPRPSLRPTTLPRSSLRPTTLCPPVTSRAPVAAPFLGKGKGFDVKSKKVKSGKGKEYTYKSSKGKGLSKSSKGKGKAPSMASKGKGTGSFNGKGGLTYKKEYVADGQMQRIQNDGGAILQTATVTLQKVGHSTPAPTACPEIQVELPTGSIGKGKGGIFNSKGKLQVVGTGKGGSSKNKGGNSSKASAKGKNGNKGPSSGKGKEAVAEANPFAYLWAEDEAEEQLDAVESSSLEAKNPFSYLWLDSETHEAATDNVFEHGSRGMKR